MNAPTNGFVAFWQTFAQQFAAHRQLLKALEAAAQASAGTNAQLAAERLVNDVRGGEHMVEALALQEAAFSRCVLAMMQAAQAGGVLDVVSGRIADAIAELSIPATSVAPPAQDNPVRFWRAFGRLLSSGVPILKTLEVLGQEVAGPQLRQACLVLRQGISAGSDMGSILRRLTNLVPPEVCDYIQAKEGTGDVDQAALDIADALAANDLSRLRAPRQGVGASAAPAQDPQAVAYVQTLLAEALGSGASDIHIDPTDDAQGLIRLRIDGVLRPYQKPPDGKFLAVIDHIKALSSLDLAERRQPQNGQILMDDCLLLLSILPTYRGERIVCRIIHRQAAQANFDLEKWTGLDEQDLQTLRRLCRLPHGLILVTGPSGSGKTTLAYAMLQGMNPAGNCVIAIEDPVEYLLPGIAQVQISPATGLTYAKAARAAYRQDPDVIYVGELLDLEMINLCAQGASTGHVVMSQLHATTACGAISRLIDMGMEPFLINSSLAAVIAQRLVRQLCPDCRVRVQPALHSLPPEVARYVQEHKDATFYGPKGCEKCGSTASSPPSGGGSGYRGRMAVHEILLPDDRLRQLILGRPTTSALHEAAVASSLRTMTQSVLAKAAKGLTSLDEVVNVFVQNCM